MEALTYQPASLTPGSLIDLQDQVRNIGDLSSGTFYIGVYLSLDDELDSSDILIAERVVFGLSIDFGSASSFQATIPDSLPVGEYKLIAIADHLDEISEHSEENNKLLGVGLLDVFIPPPPMPDLTVSAFDISPLTASVGDTVTVQDTVDNIGNLETTALIRVGVYLSTDDELSSDDVLLARASSRVFRAVRARAERSNTRSPRGSRPGTTACSRSWTTSTGRGIRRREQHSHSPRRPGDPVMTRLHKSRSVRRRLLSLFLATSVLCAIAPAVGSPRSVSSTWLERATLLDSSGAPLRLFEHRYTDAYGARRELPREASQADYVDLHAR